MTPAVSVVIPVFDGERFLAEAIRSALEQTVPPLEVLVVDDGSNDRSAAIASGFGPPVRCLRQDHAGPAAARNRGVAAARGGLVAFLDADDLWTSLALECRLRRLFGLPAVDMVFGRVQEFGSRRGHAREQTMAGLVPGAMLTSLELMRTVGPLPVAWRAGEFVEWFARAVDGGARWDAVPEVVLRRRVHGGNLTASGAGAIAAYPRVLKAVLDRRRGRSRP